MSWTAILTVLCLSIVSAYLVLIEGWAAWQAFMLVGGVALGLICSVIAVAIVFSDADGCENFRNGCKQAFDEDIGGFLKWIRGK